MNAKVQYMILPADVMCLEPAIAKFFNVCDAPTIHVFYFTSLGKNNALFISEDRMPSVAIQRYDNYQYIGAYDKCEGQLDYLLFKDLVNLNLL